MISSMLHQHIISVLGSYMGVNITENQANIFIETPLITMQNMYGPAVKHTEGDYLIWNAVPSFTHFIGLMLGSLPLMRFRVQGIRDRVLRLGVNSGELLLVHVTIRLTVCFVQNLLLLLSVMLVIQTIYRKSWQFWGALMAIMAQSVCGFAFGVLMQSFFDKSVYLLMSALVLELLTCAVAGELFFMSCNI